MSHGTKFQCFSLKFCFCWRWNLNGRQETHWKLQVKLLFGFSVIGGDTERWGEVRICPQTRLIDSEAVQKSCSRSICNLFFFFFFFTQDGRFIRKEWMSRDEILHIFSTSCRCDSLALPLTIFFLFHIKQDFSERLHMLHSFLWLNKFWLQFHVYRKLSVSLPRPIL